MESCTSWSKKPAIYSKCDCQNPAHKDCARVENHVCQPLMGWLERRRGQPWSAGWNAKSRCVPNLEKELDKINSDAQLNARLERIEQPPVWQLQRFTHVDAQNPGGRLSFLQTDFRAGTAWRRLAISQVDDPHAIPLNHQFRQSAADGNLDVIGMGSDRDYIEWFWKFTGHRSFRCGNSTAKWSIAEYEMPDRAANVVVSATSLRESCLAEITGQE